MGRHYVGDGWALWKVSGSGSENGRLERTVSGHKWIFPGPLPCTIGYSGTGGSQPPQPTHLAHFKPIRGARLYRF